MGWTQTGIWQSREIKGQGHWEFEEVGENIVVLIIWIPRPIWRQEKSGDRVN